MLGHTVRVTQDTVLEERLAGGRAGISAAQVLEVYALYDATSGSYIATRIEPRLALATWHLRGPVAELDTAQRSLRIGATSCYADAAGVLADLAVGRIARVRVGNVAEPFGGYFVSAFGVGRACP